MLCDNENQRPDRHHSCESWEWPHVPLAPVLRMSRTKRQEDHWCFLASSLDRKWYSPYLIGDPVSSNKVESDETRHLLASSALLMCMHQCIHMCTHMHTTHKTHTTILVYVYFAFYLNNINIKSVNLSWW